MTSVPRDRAALRRADVLPTRVPAAAAPRPSPRASPRVARRRRRAPGSRCGAPRCSPRSRCSCSSRSTCSRCSTRSRSTGSTEQRTTEELRYERLRAEVATLSSRRNRSSRPRAARHASPADVVDYIEAPAAAPHATRARSHVRARSADVHGEAKKQPWPLADRPPPRRRRRAAAPPRPPRPRLRRRAARAGVRARPRDAVRPLRGASRCAGSAFCTVARRHRVRRARAARHAAAGAERRPLPSDGARARRLRTIPLQRRARQHLRPQRPRPRDVDRAVDGLRRPDARHRPGAVRRRSSRRSSASTSRRSYERLADKPRPVRLHRPHGRRRGRGAGAGPRARRASAFVPEPQRQYPAGSVAVDDHRPRRRRGLRPRRPRVAATTSSSRARPARSSSSTTSTATTSPTPNARASRPRAAPTSCSRIDQALQCQVEQLARRPGDRDRGARAAWPSSSTSRTGDVRRDGDGRTARPRRRAGARRARRARHEPAADRPVRAGLDEQADHARDRDRARHRRAATPSSTCREHHRRSATKTVHRHAPRERRSSAGRRPTSCASRRTSARS